MSFDSPFLLDHCSQIAKAETLLGVTHAQALTRLISDVEAFDNVHELMHFLGDDVAVVSDESLCVRIGSNYLGLFVAVGEKVARDQTGQIYWKSVNRLKLKKIRRRL